MTHAWKLVDCTGSTNTDLLEAGKHGAPHGEGLAARRQTAGRGRRGHTWDSTEGNLLLSIVLRPNVDATQLSGLSAVAGLATIEELERRGYAGQVSLKWPNDLTARGRKLGGILVETARDLTGETFAVCGIGINLVYAPAKTPDNGLAAICLQDLDGNAPSLEDLIEGVYQSVIEGVNAWAIALNTAALNGTALDDATLNTAALNGTAIDTATLGGQSAQTGPLTPVLERYQSHIEWIGNEVIARSPAGDTLNRGSFKAVDDMGRAVIETSSGEHRYHFEQASLRLA